MRRSLELLCFYSFLLSRTAAIGYLRDSYLLDENSPRIENSMMACPCSPSTRGYSVMHNFTTALREYIEVLHEVESRSTMIILREWDIKVRSRFHLCTEEFGFEACVNMDAELRNDCRFTVTVCIFDTLTGKNLLHSQTGRGFVSAKSCDAQSEYKSDKLHLGTNFLSHGPSPTPTTSPNTNVPISYFDPIGESHFSSYSCEPAFPRNTPKNKLSAQNRHRRSKNAPSFAKRASNSTNNRPPQSSSHPGHLPVSTVSAVSAAPIAVDANLSEGCVAVEHLHGYAMQHKVNLRRKVLCHGRFCGTQNHAIIVAGETTSMKILCAEKWNCTEDVKMVNNLNLFVNRRAEAEDGIIITPHDYRFPILFTWIVQGFGQLIV